MTNITADSVEINIENDQWRIFNISGPNSLMPFFHILRGEGLLHYTSAFGEARGLPGNILSADYVKAVVVGFDERYKRWTLGLHISMREEEKPRFVELAHWPDDPSSQYAIDSHAAGRVLAEYISCPLKLFGVKKAGQPAGAGSRATVTGPLTPHEREDMPLEAVRFHAKQVELPLVHGDIWIGAPSHNMSTLTVRLPKESAARQPGENEAPAYNQIIFDKNAQTIRLVPPTGLLGAFFGPQGRVIKYSNLRNVEMRTTITHESTLEQGEDGMAVDVTKTTYLFGVYLTLQDEAVLVLRVSHEATSDLRRRRFKVKSPTRITSTTTAEDIVYLREHQKEQWRFEKAQYFAQSAALMMADITDRPLVKTTVGTPL
ncbi:MAG: hypothetical protein IT323_06250 [Anaerolineae bacterium]|nr:hypothetical protein [Anaerolineae bacterium]